jgi:hypothetical protein
MPSYQSSASVDPLNCYQACTEYEAPSTKLAINMGNYLLAKNMILLIGYKYGYPGFVEG